MTLDEEKKSMRDSYWNEREKADAERESVSTLPEMDFSDDSKATVPVSGGSFDVGVAPSPEGPPDFNVPDAPLDAPPMVATQPPDASGEMRKKRLAALDEARRIAAAPLDVPGSDAEIAQAQASDKAQRGRDAITEAIQGWLMRRPAKPQAPQDAEDLMKRRQLAESSALRQRQQQLSVQEQLVKALAGPGELNEYQKAQMERWARLDAAGGEKAKVSQEHIQNADELAKAKFEWEKTHPKGKHALSGGGFPVVAKAGDLNSVPEKDRAMVQAIINGTMKIPSSMSKEGGRIRQLVAQVKPDYDESLYPTYAATRKAFTSGAESHGINAFNTALAHMHELEANLPDNSSSPAWNEFKNWLGNKTGSAANNPYKTARVAVSEELAKAYKGGAATKDEIHNWEELLDSSASPEQMKANIGMLKKLLGGKLEAYENQWATSMPSGTVPPLKIISDRARAVMEGKAPDGQGETSHKGMTQVRRKKDGRSVWLPKAQVDSFLKQPGADGYEVVQ